MNKSISFEADFVIYAVPYCILTCVCRYCKDIYIWYMKMGITSSSISQLKENEHLKKLSSTQTISENDPFWNQLFSFSLQPIKDRRDVMLLEEATQAFSKSLFANNQHTGNFASLVKVFLSRSAELKSSTECGDEIFIWQTHNALRIIQHLCKFLVENMAEDKIIEQFEACSLDDRKKELSSGTIFTNASHANIFQNFVMMLMGITVEVPVVKSVYQLHVEVLNCIMILLSVQMFSSSPSHYGPIHKVFYNNIPPCLINSYVHGLFQNYVEQRASPENTVDHSGSFVLGFAYTVASGLKTVLRLHGGDEGDKTSSALVKHALLAHQSCLLVLVLTHYRTKDAHPNPSSNVFRNAVSSFRHVQGRQKGTTNRTEDPSFHINLSRLYTTMCNTQVLESSTLILYTLLHSNPDVKAYVLSKSDIDTLVLPILKILYEAPAQNSHHIYMALIILLILTEDDHFNKSVHEIKLLSVPWYTDRLLSDVTLGDVIILVVLRIIQFNMYQLRDRYLHTNCLAALANMSSHFRSIHSYPAQRIFELITALTKRHRQCTMKLTTLSSSKTAVEGQSCTVIEPEKNYVEDVHVLEEVIRMLLEIVNSCFSYGSLRHNANLVYAMLQKREVFDQLKKHPNFQDVLQNIETITTFFIRRLDEVTQQPLTMDEVRHVIDDVTHQLPSHFLHKFPELKFRYIEEECPEDFFVPYVWSLVFNKSGIFWDPGCVQLFSLEQ